MILKAVFYRERAVTLPALSSHTPHACAIKREVDEGGCGGNRGE